jgi:CBS domain-containing protein
MFARDVMQRQFHTLQPRLSIAEAVNHFRSASQIENKKVFGMMVTDENDRLIGMLSMYDILLFIQPKHTAIWSEIEDIDFTDMYNSLLNRVKSIEVGDLMTTEVVTITPDTHITTIMDIMIKKHIRRLPVIADQEVVGIVYISDVFYHMLKRFLK